MPKFCSKCGNQLSETDRFCPKCGANNGGGVNNNTQSNYSGQVNYNAQPNYNSQVNYNAQPNYNNQVNYNAQANYNVVQPQQNNDPRYSGINRKTMNTQAISGFICSLIGLLIATLPLGTSAIIFGIGAFRRKKFFPNETGMGFAIAGMIIGAIEIILMIYILIVGRSKIYGSFFIN